ncbi:MAG TPA: DUF1028 domain-containing protein [Gaiellaceae bacterium]|nr:DUF1028 domain-containing protein [Gaiellaceae bacterium]
MTYSIVARDAETGELGCAVQSQAFNAGAAVPWVRAGVGAIATQSFTDRRYGYRGLELLAAGRSPQDALDELLAPDELASVRQVAFLDASGVSAQWTGGDCIRCAGNVRGEGWAAQGNMLAADCWHAMGAAFEATAGSLAQRLMASLDAAEAAGGDFRGRGGAGLVVVPATGEPWERVIDLRVEEGDGSLVELRRLVERTEGDRRGLAESHILWLELLDAAAAGGVDEGKRILAELELVHPHYRDFARTASLRPDAPPALVDIVGG